MILKIFLSTPTNQEIKDNFKFYKLLKISIKNIWNPSKNKINKEIIIKKCFSPLSNSQLIEQPKLDFVYNYFLSNWHIKQSKQKIPYKFEIPSQNPMQQKIPNTIQQQQTFRLQSLPRLSHYHHQQPQFIHEPINAKQCQQLHARLKIMIAGKMNQASKIDNIDEHMKMYQEIYANSFEHTIQNDLEDLQAMKDIQQMHYMADILQHPPDFNSQLYLYSKQMPNQYERDQIQKAFKKYEEAYLQNQKIDYELDAEDAIRRAKKYLLSNTQQKNQNQNNQNQDNPNQNNPNQNNKSKIDPIQLSKLSKKSQKESIQQSNRGDISQILKSQSQS